MESKWRCERCTYENYIASRKCTLCTAPKPSYVTDDATNERDIYKMAVLSLSDNSEHAGPSNSGTISPRSSEKWSCGTCTYLNWPKTLKCVQCLTPKPRSIRAISEENLASGGFDNKWSCRNCTLDNLMKSWKCAICGTPRKSPSPPSCEGASASKDNRRRQTLYRKELLWLNACRGVLENNILPVEAYLTSGGDPTRNLTEEECSLLDRPSAFQPNQNLVHLAIRFRRDDMLRVILASTECMKKAKKRLPSHASPDICKEILHHLSTIIRVRKGEFACSFVTEIATYFLPCEIEHLPANINNELLDQILDRDVQKELEEEDEVTNWNIELTTQLQSRLYPLWNRTSGDCLLDSVLQATYGVFDKENTLRRALADSLIEGGRAFERRWRECEAMAAKALHFTLDERQLSRDWQILVQASKMVGEPLEQLHVFALAHIMRRPIIVYSIKWLKSWKGERLAPTCFEGVYLPLLWEISFCSKSPIALGYTRGHFSALVGLTGDESTDEVTYLPLTDKSGNLLALHFLSSQQRGRDEALLRAWLDCSVTNSGFLVAKQYYQNHRLSGLVKNMNAKWLGEFVECKGAAAAASGYTRDESEAESEDDV